MDPLTRILITAAEWLRHPPSPARAKIMLAAILLALGIVAIERFVGWPEWARVERSSMQRLQ